MAQVASQKYFSRSLLEDQVVEKNGTPGEIRTPDPLLRRQVLYPAELRAHALHRSLDDS